MKCQNCGGLSTDTFCSPTCEDLSVAALCNTYTRIDTCNMKLQVYCTRLMKSNNQLCHRCSQRLKKLIVGKCNGIYERV